LAITLTAAHVEAKLVILEQAFAAVVAHARLVGRALIRCESFDAGRAG
jgi:hypothetical protein